MKTLKNLLNLIKREWRWYKRHRAPIRFVPLSRFQNVDMEERLQIGREAEILMHENNVMCRAFDECAARYADKMLNTSALDDEARRYIHQQFRALRDIRDVLQEYITDAKLDVKKSSE